MGPERPPSVSLHPLSPFWLPLRKERDPKNMIAVDGYGALSEEGLAPAFLNLRCNLCTEVPHNNALDRDNFIQPAAAMTDPPIRPHRVDDSASRKPGRTRPIAAARCKQLGAPKNWTGAEKLMFA